MPEHLNAPALMNERQKERPTSNNRHCREQERAMLVFYSHGFTPGATKMSPRWGYNSEWQPYCRIYLLEQNRNNAIYFLSI